MNVVNLFKRLVSIDSPTGEEEKVAGFVAGFLRDECSLKPTVDRYNDVFIHVEGKGGRFFLTLTWIRLNQVGG